MNCCRKSSSSWGLAPCYSPDRGALVVLVGQDEYLTVAFFVLLVLLPPFNFCFRIIKVFFTLYMMEAKGPLETETPALGGGIEQVHSSLI